MKAVLLAVARRTHVIEAAVGSALIVAGVAMVSMAAALIVAGVAILIPVAWPVLTRRRS